MTDKRALPQVQIVERAFTVRFDPATEMEAEFNDWHDTEHASQSRTHAATGSLSKLPSLEIPRFRRKLIIVFPICGLKRRFQKSNEGKHDDLRND